jgi:hypothetical protein
MKPVSQYSAACVGLPPDVFVQQFPGPFLVHSSLTGGDLQPKSGARTIDALVIPEEAPNSEDEEITVFTVKQFVASRGLLAIGSGRDCAVRISAASISRIHAFLRREVRGWILEDAGSTTGTWVNGDALESRASHAVATGDHVSLGTLDFTFLTAADFQVFVRARSKS